MTDLPSVQQNASTRLSTMPWINRASAAWRTVPSLYWALGPLVLLRLVIALLIMLDILPLPPEMRFGWHLHHGGDQDIMFRLAQSIIAGKPSSEVVGLGQPLVMIPFILLLHPYYYTDMVVPLVLINGLLLAGLSVLILGIVAKHTTRSDQVAVGSAAVWAVLPLLAYYGFFWHPDALTLRGSVVPTLGWLNGLSDGPAAFFMLLAVMILSQVLASKKPPTYRRMLLLGFVFGIAVTFRVHIAFMVIFLLGYTLIAYGWRAVLLIAIGGLIAYIPQAIYNTIVFKLPFTAGYLSIYRFNVHTGNPRPLSEIIPTLPFSPRHIVEVVQQLFTGRLWLLIVVAIGVIAMLSVTLILWKRRGWQATALLIGTPLSYMLPMMMAWPFREDMIRFSIPAMPYFVALGVYSVWIMTSRWVKPAAALDQ